MQKPTWPALAATPDRRPRHPALAALCAAILLLGGCVTAPAPVTSGGTPIDTSRSAKGQDSRVQFLVLHYTVANFPLSMKILTEREVSAHYLVSDEAQPRIFRLVDEDRRAWHSGVSGWHGNRRLNASSVGIEIVHPGFSLGPDKQRIYLPFPQAQIDVLLPLIRDIVARHQIKPDRILGHGEVTPSYKEDPGPTFPWKLLADLGITPAWPDAARVAQARALFEAPPAVAATSPVQAAAAAGAAARATPMPGAHLQGVAPAALSVAAPAALPVTAPAALPVTAPAAFPVTAQPSPLPGARWFQQLLQQHGYVIETTGEWDKQTQRVMMNFQMRYRPGNYSGLPDAETAAILQVLTTPVAKP